MAVALVEVGGIDYHTLYEQPAEKTDNVTPCVVLVHALMSNLHMWDLTVTALHNAGYSTLRFDYVGHGATPAISYKAKAYHMDDVTRHINEIIKRRTAREKVHAVVGCSVGGVLALRYAMMFPEAVNRVISITAPDILSSPQGHDSWTQRIKQFEKDEQNKEDTLRHMTVERWFPGNDDITQSVRHEALNHVKKCSLDGYKVMADVICDYNYSKEVSEIQNVKCLVVAGGRDTTSSVERLRDIAGQIRESRFENITDSGHIPSMHYPDVFNQLMLDFLG